jgi:hypothetical protein
MRTALVKSWKRGGEGISGSEMVGWRRGHELFLISKSLCFLHKFVLTGKRV